MNKKINKIDKFHHHEVIDRANMICDIIDTTLSNHPALSYIMQENIDKAIELLYNVSNRACGEYCNNCGSFEINNINIHFSVCEVCKNIQRR